MARYGAKKSIFDFLSETLGYGFVDQFGTLLIIQNFFFQFFLAPPPPEIFFQGSLPPVTFSKKISKKMKNLRSPKMAWIDISYRSIYVTKNFFFEKLVRIFFTKIKKKTQGSKGGRRFFIFFEIFFEKVTEGTSVRGGLPYGWGGEKCVSRLRSGKSHLG